MSRMIIAVTQRVEYVHSYAEVRDCLDQEWTTLLEQLGFDVIPVPNRLVNPEEWLDRLKVDGIVLTGGNDLSTLASASNVSKQRDDTETKILEWSTTSTVPVLGICRGMQFINHFLGGDMSQVDGHVASNHSVNSVDGNRYFSEYPSVNSYHSWGILRRQLADSLEPLAISEDGVIEACRHIVLPWLGIMWHPERNLPPTEFDKKLIFNLFMDQKREQ